LHRQVAKVDLEWARNGANLSFNNAIRAPLAGRRKSRCNAANLRCRITAQTVVIAWDRSRFPARLLAARIPTQQEASIVTFRSQQRRRRAPVSEVVEIPSRRVLKSIIHAGALVALADGTVDAAERRALLTFLRRNGLLARYGRRETLGLLDNATTLSSAARLEALCDAADALRPLAGSPASSLIARAARRVMLADGIAWPQEVAMLRIIKNRLGLSQD
jgi:tellurite resistance protein